MKIAIITAGGAGMFCGSCMQDNTMARALSLAGADAVLVPTYTPIRVDEENVSSGQIFLGGVNVYLDSTVPGWKRLPGWMVHWLNRPRILRWLTQFSSSTDAAQLGPLTLDMLKGANGPQKREVHEFVEYLCQSLQPDIIVFSNALLSGVLSELRPRFAGRILCLLQGDDVFLEALPPSWRTKVIKQLTSNCSGFDGFLTHSEYYRDFMSDYLSLPASKFRQIPLTIDLQQRSDADVTVASESSTDGKTPGRFRVGYFARICEEKGIHNLLSAAEKVLPDHPELELAIGGFLPEQNRPWFERELSRLQQLVPGRVSWLGSPDSREDKMQIIRSFDLLCMPTSYKEPKGIYVLEAASLGVPALLPNHGAFPELIAKLGQGILYNPTTDDLADVLHRVARAGQLSSDQLAQHVLRNFSMDTTAPLLLNAMTSFES